MSNIALDWKRIGKELTTLAQNVFSKRATELATDGEAFLKLIEQRTIKYHLQYAAGRIQKDDFENQMLNLQALLELEKYKQEGLTRAAIDRFAKGAIDILVNALLAALP